MKIGIKAYDESHLHFANIGKIDFHTNTYKTFYISATPAKSNNDENMIYQFYFKNVAAIDLFDEDTDPHSHYLAFKFNSKPTPQEISDCRNQYGLDRNKYTNYIVTKPNYYKMLRILLDRAIKNGKKNLFYIATNEAILITKAWIEENYPELENEIGVYTSITKEDKMAQLDKRIILSTTKSCSAAADIKGLKMVVVLAEPFKSEVIARQSLGRLRDHDTFYVEVVDTGFFYINKYYHSKQIMFEKYALDCTEIVFAPTDLDYQSELIIAERDRIAQLLRITSINPVQFMNRNKPISPVMFLDRSVMINPVTFIKG